MHSKFSKYFPYGLAPGKIVPFAHKGEWAVHEVLPFLYGMVGSFHLSLATFNVSEESLRPIFFMKERGDILTVRLLLDANIRRHKLDMLFFTASFADEIRVSSTHMKVLLCENDNICLAIVGSANMNRNARHEAGIITTDGELFRYYMDYYQSVFHGDSQLFEI